MALTGDVKENYVQLQQTTGERFSSMADRLTSPQALQNLDRRGRAGNEELAGWLRGQSDDEDAILRATDPQAFAARERGERVPDKTKAPQARTQDKHQN